MLSIGQQTGPAGRPWKLSNTVVRKLKYQVGGHKSSIWSTTLRCRPIISVGIEVPRPVSLRRRRSGGNFRCAQMSTTAICTTHEVLTWNNRRVHLRSEDRIISVRDTCRHWRRRHRVHRHMSDCGGLWRLCAHDRSRLVHDSASLRLGLGGDVLRLDLHGLYCLGYLRAGGDSCGCS